MKKLMKLMCVFALVFVAGCGASSSTDEQKEVVTNFFDYVKECEITKLKKVASEDVLSGMDLEKMEKELSQYTEEERVYFTNDDGKKKLRMYKKGHFIYRLAGREREKSASYYTPEVLTKCLVKYALKELLEGKTADEILHLTIMDMFMQRLIQFNYSRDFLPLAG